MVQPPVAALDDTPESPESQDSPESSVFHDPPYSPVEIEDEDLHVARPDEGEEVHQEPEGAIRGKSGIKTNVKRAIKNVKERWVLSKSYPDQSRQPGPASPSLSPGSSTTVPGPAPRNLTPYGPDKGQLGGRGRAGSGPLTARQGSLPLSPRPVPELVATSPPPPLDGRRRLPPGGYLESPPSPGQKNQSKRKKRP